MKNTLSPLLNDVFKLIENYDSTAENVLNYQPAESLYKELDFKLEDKGSSKDELIDDIKKYLEFSPNTRHPLYNNQLNAGSTDEAIIAEIVTMLTNTTMATYEVSPVATLMEKELVNQLNKKIGFVDGDGIMLTGGSNANMMAIHLARHTRFPETKNVGNQNRQMCVFVSKEAHYSHKKAMMLLGLGIDNLILVNTDEQGRMCMEDLEAKLVMTIMADKIPLMVCSTAGTTVLGAFDPILETNEICKQYGLWHHVDGAWGGALMFSEKHNHLLEGLERVDSVTFDAHKLLGSGLITSFILTKGHKALKHANSGGGCHYLFHEYENERFDYGRKSLQCGRKVDSLKLWLTWKSLGHEGMEKIVDQQFEKQVYFTNLIKEHPRLKLVHEPIFLNVCFQVIPTDEEVDINRYNYDLRFKLVQSGKLMTNYSWWEDGTVFFRQVFANHNTTKEDLEKIINTIVDMAK